jgi:hypothetical protein
LDYALKRPQSFIDSFVQFLLSGLDTLQYAEHNSFLPPYAIVEADLFMHKNIDPAIMPGKYKSHLHYFFGSDAVTTNTTSSTELQAGCTTT